MAENSSFPAHAESASKTVQELITSGKELPEKYIYKGSDAGKLDASLPLMDVPIIDIGLLTSPSSSTHELEKLRSALSFWGCFQVRFNFATYFLNNFAIHLILDFVNMLRSWKT